MGPQAVADDDLFELAVPASGTSLDYSLLEAPDRLIEFTLNVTQTDVGTPVFRDNTGGRFLSDPADDLPADADPHRLSYRDRELLHRLRC